MFVHLHCHSHYSFLRGIASPDEIIAAAVEQKMPAVALTDTNGMYAAVPFYKKAQDAGIKPIVGVALDVAIDNGNDEILRCAQHDKQKQRDITMVLLASDMEVTATFASSSRCGIWARPSSHKTLLPRKPMGGR